MIRLLRRITYFATTLIAGVALLAGSSFALDHAQGRDPRVRDSLRRFQLDYLSYNSQARSHVFRDLNLAPGTIGTRRLVVGNDGRRYVRRISLTQDRVVNTGFGRALRLQVWDETTNRCIYPAPAPTAPQLGRCRQWGEWAAGDQLRQTRIVPLSGGSWRPGERHALVVRYSLRDWSTNIDQGQDAGFRLRWWYHG
jgi:hypothetical protein